MRLRLIHGWGFDAGLWRAMAALLPEADVEFCDRGYFGEPSAATGEPAVVVAHSFGAMLALRAPESCLGLVAINGFDRFTGQDDVPGVPRRVVERMAARFAAQPLEVLAEFRRRCGHADAVSAPDIGRLKDDLDALRDWDCREETARFGRLVLSIQGTADPILPPAMRDAVFASAPQVARVTHPSGGHLLPLTDPAFCAEHVRAFVEQLA